MTELLYQNSLAGRAEVKTTRASRLVACLRTSILRGDMRPGEKISLDRLREEYQVSLSPLREGISRLVSSRLVDGQDQRGYRVAPVSPADLAEIVALRGTLETQALRASIARADLDWESAVLGSLHRLNRIEADTDATMAARLEEAQRDFSAALIANCRMPILTDICAMLFDLNIRYLNLFGAALAAEPAAKIERSAIAQAAVGQDPDTTTALLVRHLDRLGAAIAPRIATPPPKP